MCSSPRAASEASEGGASAPPPRGEGRWGGQGRGRERKEWRRFRHDWRERTQALGAGPSAREGGETGETIFISARQHESARRGVYPLRVSSWRKCYPLARKLLGATAHSRLAKTWSHARTRNLCRARQPTLASNEGGEQRAIQTECRSMPPPRK